MLPGAFRTLAVVCLCCLAVLGAACNRRHQSSEKQSEAVPNPAPGAIPAASAPTTAPANAPLDASYAPKVSDLRVADKIYEKRLLRGFYETNGGWRWTAHKFAVSLDVPQPLAPMYLEMDFNLPNEVMNQVPSVTLITRVNHQEI